ncbi:MAG: hypothetical protein EOP62_11625 [Sphingomonadales bacterium]|nr:MAG: hypothetical protein EOP62_11625 [Sphingomonadales bacterium]
MQFSGKHWLLWEDEPVDLNHTRFFEFAEGVVLDGRTGDTCGSYVERDEGVDAVFDERHGEREVVKFRMHPEFVEHDLGFSSMMPPFDPVANAYALTFSNVRYEEYASALPANDHETDEQKDARNDWEAEQFGIVPMFGFSYRDCPEVREMGESNEREYLARQRREGMALVG